MVADIIKEEDITNSIGRHYSLDMWSFMNDLSLVQSETSIETKHSATLLAIRCSDLQA